MELKRILARDSRAANEKAIQLYGKDVLIISSQRLDNQTELIVAVDLVEHASTPVVGGSQVAELSQQETSEAFVPFSKLFQSASAFAPLESDETMSNASPVIALHPEAASVAVMGVNVAGTHQIPAADLTQPASAEQVRHEGQRSQEIVELLRLEMAALRREFSLSRQMMPWQEGLRLSPAVQQLSMAMSEVGIPVGLRALLTDSIQEFSSIDQAWPVMQNLLVNALARPVMALPEVGVHALCGPSGAGKTSMVGRLAFAAAQLHGADSQVMVSFADQRPGAWAQMQLLAAQSGVACFRAANSDVLRILLEDLAGKTVWIDTCGTDFGAQAELLLMQHPKVLRHAVLPVDATVTSVQKILQNSALNWSSLMLSKVDEAAYPWALIKGLTEQPLGVSCVAGDCRIDRPIEAFDPLRLVNLAMSSVFQLLPTAVAPQHLSVVNTLAVATLQVVEPAFEPVRFQPEVEAALPAVTQFSAIGSDEDIVIPSLMGSVGAAPIRKKSTRGSRVSKVTHG